MKESTINKQLIGAVLLCLCLSAMTFAKVEHRDYNPNVATYYTSAGMISQPTRVWDGIVNVTTGSAQTVDLSSAGFSSINSITITPANNTSTTTSMPLTSIKSYTNTSVTFNTLVSNSGVVGLLVALVTPTSFTGMSVHVHADGW